MGHWTTSYRVPNVLEDIQAAVTQLNKQNQGAFTQFCKNTSRTELYGKKAVKINATRYKVYIDASFGVTSMGNLCQTNCSIT